MSAAVDRLVAQAVEQGFGEHVSDEVAQRCGAILRRTRTDRPEGRPGETSLSGAANEGDRHGS